MKTMNQNCRIMSGNNHWMLCQQDQVNKNDAGGPKSCLRQPEIEDGSATDSSLGHIRHLLCGVLNVSLDD